MLKIMTALGNFFLILIYALAGLLINVIELQNVHVNAVKVTMQNA
jgi:hypothetical protein